MGNHKELEIYINSKGSKVFSITIYDKYGKKHKYKLEEFRVGIYNVLKARRDAIKLLNKFDELGKDFNLLNWAKKHTYKELFIKYMDKKIKIDGDSRYIDAGILARYDFGSIISFRPYVEASFRYGRNYVSMV